MGSQSTSRRARIAAALKTAPGHFDDLHDRPSDEHPVDLAVAKAPAIVAAYRRLRREQRRLERSGVEPKGLLPAYDAATELRFLTEEYYFHVGFELGTAAGRSEQRLRSRRARMLAKRLWSAVLLAELPQAQAVATLLETARAVVLPIPRRRRRTP